MNAVVELVYDDPKKNRRIEVPCKGKGERLMNSIDKAVTKVAADDSEWIRWNLIDIKD